MIREKKLRSPANVQLNTRLTTRMRLHNTLFIFDLSSLTACIASTHAGLKMPEFSSKFHFDQGIFQVPLPTLALAANLTSRRISRKEFEFLSLVINLSLVTARSANLA